MDAHLLLLTDDCERDRGIEDELRRRNLPFDVATVSNPSKACPQLQVGETILAGAREIYGYFFDLLDRGYTFLPNGTPVRAK